MCGGNLYRSVSFQYCGYISFSCSCLIFRSSINIRLVGGCGGQHPLAARSGCCWTSGRAWTGLKSGSVAEEDAVDEGYAM